MYCGNTNRNCNQAGMWYGIWIRGGSMSLYSLIEMVIKPNRKPKLVVQLGPSPKLNLEGKRFGPK